MDSKLNIIKCAIKGITYSFFISIPVSSTPEVVIHPSLPDHRALLGILFVDQVDADPLFQSDLSAMASIASEHIKTNIKTLSRYSMHISYVT